MPRRNSCGTCSRAEREGRSTTTIKISTRHHRRNEKALLLPVLLMALVCGTTRGFVLQPRSSFIRSPDSRPSLAPQMMSSRSPQSLSSASSKVSTVSIPSATRPSFASSSVQRSARSSSLRMVSTDEAAAFVSQSASSNDSSVLTPPSASSSATTTTLKETSIASSSDYDYTQALQRTAGWVGAACLYGGFLWQVFGPTTGEEFFAGYLLEQSLSVDNLFVFLMLFEYFQVPMRHQDRVLSWGIYGAIVMRAVMIGLGSVAIQQFHGILLVFAAILIYSSAQFFIGSDAEEEDDPSQNAVVKFSKRLIDSSDHFDGGNFFTIEDGIRKATPLLICLIAVEISDIVFAVDSIPAVFGVTENPLVVFTSNMFAIMGLRSLYTILSKAATDLKYLEPAVAVVLAFIGCKMIAEFYGVIVPTTVAVSFVATALGTGIGASVWEKRRALEDGEESSGSEPDNSSS